MGEKKKYRYIEMFGIW